jgi:hypothetical protein
VYFSGIDVDQLLSSSAWPIRRTSSPSCRRTGNLDHLLFDVGFDYRTTDQGLLVLKSGYYGVF